MSRRVDHTKLTRQWSDEDKAKLQAFWDDQVPAPPPTREEVLAAFPELRPKKIVVARRRRGHVMSPVRIIWKSYREPDPDAPWTIHLSPKPTPVVEHDADEQPEPEEPDESDEPDEPDEPMSDESA